MCLLAWSFRLEDSSFFSVMCWGKQTGMNSNALGRAMKQCQVREQSEEAPVTRITNCSMCALIPSHGQGNFPFLYNSQRVPSTFSLPSQSLS